MKYEVSLFIKDNCIVSWRFKSFMQAIKFCADVDTSLVDILFVRISDCKQFDVLELLDLF